MHCATVRRGLRSMQHGAVQLARTHWKSGAQSASKHRCMQRALFSSARAPLQQAPELTVARHLVTCVLASVTDRPSPPAVFTPHSPPLYGRRATPLLLVARARTACTTLSLPHSRTTRVSTTRLTQEASSSCRHCAYAPWASTGTGDQHQQQQQQQQGFEAEAVI